MFTSLKNSKKGFTLIELLIVIAIIGILSSVVLASLGQAREKSRDAKRISDLGQVQLALELMFDSKQAYPAASSTIAGICTSAVNNCINGNLAVSVAAGGFGYLPKVPAPQGGSVLTYYVYVGSDSSAVGCNIQFGCTSYGLGAQLERTDNSALNNDADQAVAANAAAPAVPAFAGASADCLGAAGAERCYDIKP